MRFTASLLLPLWIVYAVAVVQHQSSGAECVKQPAISPPKSRPTNCPDPKNVPSVKGTLKDNECLIGGIVGGDFFNACYAPDMSRALASIAGGGKDGGGIAKAKQDWSGGSGPYNAHYFTDPSLPLHTIYAPKVPVAGRKLPLLVWGNGACGTNGAGFSNFLTEISSHGFMVIASGAPKIAWGTAVPNYSASLLSSTSGEKSRAVQLTQAIDWAEKGAAGGKYGEVDMAKVGVAGQSCGAVEAYSASVFDARVKVIGIHNTGVIDPGRRHYLKEIKQPIGFFYGGPADFAAEHIQQDYKDIPENLPAIMSSLQVGHMGTYFEPKGGKSGVASLAFFKWQLQGDSVSKQMFFNSSSQLFKDGWIIDTKHWKEG